MSWAGQRRVGEKPHISSRRNLISRPFWQGGSRRFLRDSLRLQKVCECVRACVWGKGGDLSGLIFVGLFLTFC